MTQVTPAILALLAAIFGGAGLKVIEKWLNRSKEKEDAATQMRRELREEITQLRTELSSVELQLDEWKEKYYKLREEFLHIKTELDIALNTIKEANAASASQAAAAQRALANTPPPVVE